MGRGISKDQEVIVRLIGETLIEYRDNIGKDPEWDWYWRRQLAWGAKWKSYAENASERASASRALRRLEARGLVVRRNIVSGPSLNEPYAPPSRTTHVAMTADGWRIYQRLTSHDVSIMLTDIRAIELAVTEEAPER